jgi:hypothetical protein
MMKKTEQLEDIANQLIGQGNLHLVDSAFDENQKKDFLRDKVKIILSFIKGKSMKTTIFLIILFSFATEHTTSQQNIIDQIRNNPKNYAFSKKVTDHFKHLINQPCLLKQNRMYWLVFPMQKEYYLSSRTTPLCLLTLPDMQCRLMHPKNLKWK